MNCPICGKPTFKLYGNERKDGLCAEHGKDLKNGDIYLCDKCGKYHKANENCNNKENHPKTQENNLNGNKKCLLCGGETENGNLYCKKCYFQYKDKSITVVIKNLSEYEIIDKYANAIYKCKDGRSVRSKSEKIISDFLFDNNIRAIYEKTVYYYPENGEPIQLHPDFYLPDKNIYIEHNGLSNNTYKSNKEKTEKMYQKLNYTVVVTIEKDLEDIDAKLKPILKIN